MVSRTSVLFVFLVFGGCVTPATTSSSGTPRSAAPKADGEEEEGDYLGPDIVLGDDDDDVVMPPARDEATYGYTDPPGDIAYLPGEFERADSMLVSWSELDEWEARLIANALPYIKVRVVTPSDQIDGIRIMLNTDYGVVERQFADIDFITENELDGALPMTVWMRDFGPLATVLETGGHRLIDFRYHDARVADDGLPTRLANYWQLPVSRPQLQIEGGNIQSNGSGTCVVTEYATERNIAVYGADFGEEHVKSTLRDYLGCWNTVVVPRLSGEGTGHVDMYVHITGRDTVLVGEYTTEQDQDNAHRTNEGARLLEEAGFTVTRIPMPTPVGRTFRSYTNALAVNDGVLVPVYPSDLTYEERALEIFRDAYPGRTIVPLAADDVIVDGGAIHCSTMSIGNVPE